MDADTDALIDRARAWAAQDPDAHTREALEHQVTEVAGGDPQARDRLADQFDGTLEFGTAGLRGELGPGPNRMNRLVVLRAAAGLAAYLREQGASGPGASVVVGYDARHGSRQFALDTVAVMGGAGLTAWLLPEPLPTPVLAFAVRELGCVAGVMVTASHNPPADNGYKVYLGDGSQIVPPADADIARCIAAVGRLEDVPRGDGGRVVGRDLVDHYLDTVAALAGDGPRDLHTVYTPLHGVGAPSVLAALETAGFEAPLVVPEQEEPDPDFPTVAFPNPEEPGALDLALALAAERGVDLVVANDPDADRCAAAVPVETSESAAGWRLLRGDEIGVLLADHLLRHGRTGTFAASVVSSSLLGKVAAAAGQPYTETLTGFKWIGRVEGLGFGYEEALGYCCDPAHVRDKDGVSALLLLCELAAELKAAGLGLVDRLDELARTHGLHATDQVSVRVGRLALIEEAMDRLRRDPPRSLGGLDVEAVDDLLTDGGPLPPTDALRFRLAGGARVVCRPSGTEPKLKAYLEVVVPVEVDGGGGGVDAARVAAATRLDALGHDVRAALGL